MLAAAAVLWTGGLHFTLSPAMAAPPGGDVNIAADVNVDGYVDRLDLRSVVRNIGQSSPLPPTADTNDDGNVNVLDLALVARDLGKLAPRPLRSMKIWRVFPELSFVRPTNLVVPVGDGGRIFVTEQVGLVRSFSNDAVANAAPVFLDIRDRVSRFNLEEGLLGLAFPSGFAGSGQFFVYYSASGPRRSVVSRFAISGDDPRVADPASELVVMEIPQPFGNHNGGQLAFGPDGYLYVGLGDGGSGGDPLGNGQNPGTLLGSILRIDVPTGSGDGSYRTPPDNPFVGVSGAREEVWAYGVRNPWRFAFDRHTGLLWLGDVGQNQWEEVDIIERGRNYGWKVMEGDHCFSPPSGCDRSGLEMPIVEYDHSEGCSITGGHVYRGRGMPSLLGSYVYADFCSGVIWALRYDGEQVTEHMRLVDSGLNISSFGRDQAENLYILTLDGGIYTLAPAE